MSYRKTFVESVFYSGSKRVHYPASKYGASLSVSYSGHVPVTVHIDVDTQPFDRSVGTTQTSLNVVAGAVAATEAAQVAEIQRDADAVAKTTIKGFFRVVASELSAKASEFLSSMRSCVGLLGEEARQVDRIHQQMESDYTAIRARYLRIFTELDRELDMRIRELDRPAFFVCKRAMADVVVTPYKDAAAKALTVPADVDATLLKLMCARAKQTVSTSLDTLGDVCGYLTEYGRSVASIMSSDASEGNVLMPVVYIEEQDLDTAVPRIVVQGGGNSPGLADEVRASVVSGVATTPEGAWRQIDPSDRQRIDSSFSELVDGYRSSHGDEEGCERICQQILELFRQDQPTCAYTTNDA